MSLELIREKNKDDVELDLQLGDVIRITNPLNQKLNEQTFIIDYIDNSKAYLTNEETFDNVKILINPDGTFGDGNITKIAILSRADTPSYARQNGLLPGKWVNIYFGGDFPIILTGEITNLEEDMIELTTVDKDTIYINFDYKGIPEDLPIDNIEIREKPYEPIISEEVVEPQEEVVQQEPQQEQQEQLEEIIPEKRVEEFEITVPVKNVREQLRELILKADQIEFGDEELGPVVQFVDVSYKQQRYSVDKQVNDLLDDLLSTIPNSQRTSRVLNNIHTMIEVFKQLRQKFSSFDEYGNVNGMLTREATFKPLVDRYLADFKTNLYWILPIVKNAKKIYDLESPPSWNDVIPLKISLDVEQMENILSIYKSSNLPEGSNKYSDLYSDLNKYFTPFETVNEENMSNIIAEKETFADLNVIVDNLEDMYSSVYSANYARNKRFLITKYNLGLSKLEPTDMSGPKMVTIRVPMTKNDEMSIRSIMMLPEPTIRFSKINLPNTNSLEKATLNQHFLNYWQLLKSRTAINNVFIDSLENELDFDSTSFASSIYNYVLNIPDDELKQTNKTANEIYKEYCQTIIPKIRVLFNLMKKYITGKLSIVDVVSYLEPFLIYTDDLTFMQYKEIVSFIDDKISEYNKYMINRSRIFKSLSAFKESWKIESNTLSVINIIPSAIRDEIFYDGYKIDDKTRDLTNSEILRKITIKDYGHLYTSSISYNNIALTFPSNINDIFEKEKQEIKEELDESKNDETCQTIVIAKYYASIEELENDNDKDTYFDKKYDTTKYSLMEDSKDGYAKEVLVKSPEDLRDYIVKDLVNKKNMSDDDAIYLADTLINGHKKVIDGQFAILYKGYHENYLDENDFYIRKNNKWILDNSVNKAKANALEPSILCDLQESCINVSTSKNADKCESVATNELSLQTKLLQNIMSEFDSKYKMSKEAYETTIREKFEYFKSIISLVDKIETSSFLKSNNIKYKMGLSIAEDIDDMKSLVKISPYAKILNYIFIQDDFVKKQYDIKKFVEDFTRPAVRDEDPHWVYCDKTDVKLMPTFKYTLAHAFTLGPNIYNDELELIKTNIGQISDDGDWWIDKFSGWPICKIDFDIEEGYEKGFKISTRAALEESAGSKISAETAKKNITFTTPEIIMITNIINTLSIAMGINMESQKQFIINIVLSSLNTMVESEADYKIKIKEMANRGKKIPSYKEFYNTFLLYYTLGAFLIAIQVSIPSIKTRKTHPGCVRSFSGYPFEGAGDYSSINYLACVANDIRSSGEPWNVLKGSKSGVEKIQEKIKYFIDNTLLPLPDIQRKILEKTEYLLTVPPSDISNEHSIANWTQFLPPLVPFKIKHLLNISKEFERGLLSDLRSGSENQREKILVIESKIIQFSLAIQEKINDIVRKNKPLLHTATNDPYLENACCVGTEQQSTVQYFIQQNSEIEEYNRVVNNLTNILDDIIYYKKSGLFFDPSNTRLFYPPVTNSYSEKTVYMSFIYYCKFKSLMPTPPDLQAICLGKPELINQNDSIEAIINRLKEDGRTYTSEQLLRLLQIIGRHNIINIRLDTPVISSITKLLGTIEYINDSYDDVIEPALTKLLFNALDTFDVATTEYSKQTKELNNFLLRGIEDMKEEIVDFIEVNKDSKKRTTRTMTKSINFIKNISNDEWNIDKSNRKEDIKISSDANYTVINFYKTFIANFVSIFPTIILNKVNYDDTNIPSYYNFSWSHIKKLKDAIGAYFEELKPFYGVNQLNNVLNTIQSECKNLLKLSDNIHSFSSIKNGETILKGIIDERTGRFLQEYLLLKIFIHYIELADNPEMVVSSITKTQDVTDIVTMEFMDDEETQIDLSLSSRNVMTTDILTGNKKQLKIYLADLFVAFISMMEREKNIVDTTYEEIQDRVFKLKEREKDMVTDRLKSMTDEARDVDTVMKITKQGLYSKGMQKGLTVYDKDFYGEEQDLRDQMIKLERKMMRNAETNDKNIDILVDEALEQQQADAGIDMDAYDMSYMNEDFYNGNTDGVDAPEEDQDDYDDYN